MREGKAEVDKSKPPPLLPFVLVADYSGSKGGERKGLLII